MLAAARMQRWALLLSAYTYKLEYRSTRAHGNADGLSRLPTPQEKFSLHSESTIYNVCQVEYLPVTFMQLQRATRRDPVLCKVLNYTKSGWPSHFTSANKVIPEELKPFWSRRHELTTECDCLLWGTRVVIPQKLYTAVLQEIHSGHPGIVRMKAISRSYVWWPGLDKAIETQVRNCKDCQVVKQTPPKAPLHPWVWLSHPWEHIHVDFAGPFLHKMFMVVTDAHSKWPEIIDLSDTTSSKTIQELRKLFAAYGLSQQVVTDNGPQLTSTEFSCFMKSNGIKHIRCSPYHPSSNGVAERLVQTFKRSLKVTVQQGKSVSQRLCEFLLSYRNTPHSTTNETPSILFLKRQLRTRLDLLRPTVQVTVDNKQAQQKQNHDVHTKQRDLFVGTPILAKNFTSNPQWLPGVIIDRVAPLTYSIQLHDGRIWRRHIDHIIVTSSEDQETQRSAPQSPHEESCDNWSYTYSDNINIMPPYDQAVTSPLTTEGGHRYPTRTRRPPQRLIEQTDL